MDHLPDRTLLFIAALHDETGTQLPVDLCLEMRKRNLIP